MDLFREESIHKVDSGLNTFVFVIANIGMVLFGFIGLNMLMSILNGRINTVNIVGFVIFGGLAFGLFILRNNQKIEYDYTFTNGTLDIAKVINNTKRKKLLSTNIKDFEAIASTKDEGFTPVSYTHLRAHETDSYLVCRLLLEKKKKQYYHNK